MILIITRSSSFMTTFIVVIDFLIHFIGFLLLPRVFHAILLLLLCSDICLDLVVIVLLIGSYKQLRLRHLTIYPVIVLSILRSHHHLLPKDCFGIVVGV